MAEITAALVKQLRDKTGAGMMECKKALTEANGNLYTTDGSRMYSLEGMARWNPTQGRKAGFGGFYFNRDYYSKTGIPYYNMRRCIQIANPAQR